MTAVTLNGNAYSDDGSQSRDMRFGGHQQWLLPMLQDAMTEVDSANNAAISADASADAAANSATSASDSAALAATFSMNTDNYPTIRPSLNLDFANSKVLDPRITYTRASTATYTDSDGLIKSAAVNTPRFDHDPVTGVCKGLLIEEARTNLLTYSENFDNAVWIKFGATVTPNAALAPDGTMTADVLIVTSVSAGVQLRYPASGNAATTTHNVSIWIRQTAGVAATLVFDLGDGAASVSAAISGVWKRISGLVSQGTADTYLDITVSNIGTYEIWGAQLETGSYPTSYIPSNTTFTSRASTATYIGSDGLIQTAAINEARMNYNPANLTLAPKLLLEGARTNLLLNSLLNGTNLATQSITTTAAQRTLSFYGTGTVVLSGTHAATVVGLGAYPTRTTYTYTPTAGTLTLTVTGTVQFANDELGAYATSFIPTSGTALTRSADVSTSTAATRSADLARMTGSNFSDWYKQNEGTFLISQSRSGLASSGTLSIFNVQYDAANFLQIRQGTVIGGSDVYSKRANVVQVDTNSAAVTAGVLVNQALAYATNNLAFVNNGVVTGTDADCTFPMAQPFNELGFTPSGHISRLAYYPKRLSNTELQALSTI